MKLSAEIDPADIRALDRVTHRIAREMPKDAAEVVTMTARITVRKAYQATPKARKTTIWAWADKDKGIRMRVPRRKTPGAAYAKACWIPALRKLGARAADRPSKDGDYSDRRRGLSPVFAAHNNCPYIEDLDAGGTLEPIPSKPMPHPAKPANIGAKAVLRGTAELEKRMDKFAAGTLNKWGT